MALAGDHVQVLVDGYELTGDSNRVFIDDMITMLDATTFGDAAHKFIPGQRNVSLEHAGWLNADAARSHPVLKANSIEGYISVLLGQNAAPVVGDPAYSLGLTQGKYSTLIEVAQMIPFTANFATRGTRGGWGRTLAVPVAFTNSTNGSSVDDGAATSDGGAAYLHVLTAAASDTYTLTVEGSATGAFGGEETTLATFTLDGSALGSERVAIGGSIPRYTRWTGARSGSAGDAVQIAVNLVRF
jgi:hypothetical protein